MQDFDFNHFSSNFASILTEFRLNFAKFTKFAQKILLGNAAASPAPTALDESCESRASVEKFPGESNGKKTEKLQKIPKNSTIKPLSGGGNGKKTEK